MSAYAIGVDLGGTNLRAAAIDTEGRLLQRISEPAVYDAGPERVATEIARLVERVRASVSVDGLAGVGIGAPGFIDIDSGIVVGAANLPNFNGFPLRDRIQNHLGTTILLENDANAAALGELWMGAGRGFKDLVLFTLGTGIGGGIVVDGKILHGATGMAGEFGHMTVFPDGNPCGCGNCGCLEKHASASAIAAMGKMMHFAGEPNVTAARVYELAAEGNERAKQVFESVGRALGIAIANLVNVFNFPLYVLSGGPLPAWDFFSPAMFAELKKRSFVFERTGARVERALLGADAGLYGAAYLPLQKMEQSESVLVVVRN